VLTGELDLDQEFLERVVEDKLIWEGLIFLGLRFLSFGTCRGLIFDIRVFL